jgi:hypothetical protein
MFELNQAAKENSIEDGTEGFKGSEILLGIPLAPVNVPK